MRDTGDVCVTRRVYILVVLLVVVPLAVHDPGAFSL